MHGPSRASCILASAPERSDAGVSLVRRLLPLLFVSKHDLGPSVSASPVNLQIKYKRKRERGKQVHTSQRFAERSAGGAGSGFGQVDHLLPVTTWDLKQVSGPQLPPSSDEGALGAGWEGGGIGGAHWQLKTVPRTQRASQGTR